MQWIRPATISRSATLLRRTQSGRGTMLSTPSSRGFASWQDTPNIRMEKGDDGIAIFTLDQEGKPVNTVSSKLMSDFEQVLATVEGDSTIRAAIFRSAKKGIFIAGADIDELAACKTEKEIQVLSEAGQDIFNRLSRSTKPFVAAIDGACLGGGLEFALACHYRIASSSKKTVLGLPEVKLGLLPGAGGTQRFPQLVGLQEGIKAITTGANIRPDKAKKIGLVSVVADPNALMDAARMAATGLADGSLSRNPKKPKSWFNWLLEDTSFGRSILFKKARETAAKVSGGNYPSIPAIMDCVEASTGSLEAGLKMEAHKFGELSVTPQHR